MNTHYDIAILGGGFVGHTLRIACAKLGLTACMVEAKASSFQTPASDGRAIALSYSSVTLLKHLGVWEGLASHATAIESVHVSALGRLGTMLCCANDLEIDYLGQVVPAPILGAALTQFAVEGFSSFLYIDEVIGLEHHPECIKVNLKNGELTASLVLACDGTDSFCREYLHMNTEEKSSHKKAIVMNLCLDKPHGHRAFQRLIPHGVCALLPLPGNKVTVVLSLEDTQADAMNVLDDTALSKAIEAMWGGRFGKMRVEGARFIYPLRQVYVKDPVAERVILMGNAAHTLNPIAAQGLNVALRDISVLYDILEDAKALSKDFGEYVPNVYRTHVQPAHEKMAQITDCLVNISYASYLAPFQGLGLSLLQQLPFMKTRMAKAFAGLDGHVGSLMGAS